MVRELVLLEQAVPGAALRGLGLGDWLVVEVEQPGDVVVDGSPCMSPVYAGTVEILYMRQAPLVGRHHMLMIFNNIKFSGAYLAPTLFRFQDRTINSKGNYENDQRSQY